MRIKTLTCLLALTLIAAPISALAISSTAATTEARGFIHAVATGDFTSPQKKFTRKMQQAVPPKKLKMVWDSVTGRFGKLKSVGKSQVMPYKAYKIVFVKTEFTRKSVVLKVAINSAGKIAGFFIVPPSRQH